MTLGLNPSAFLSSFTTDAPLLSAIAEKCAG